jgi:hypothetical protein
VLLPRILLLQRSIDRTKTLLLTVPLQVRPPVLSKDGPHHGYHPFAYNVTDRGARDTAIAERDKLERPVLILEKLEKVGNGPGLRDTEPHELLYIAAAVVPHVIQHRLPRGVTPDELGALVPENDAKFCVEEEDGLTPAAAGQANDVRGQDLVEVALFRQYPDLLGGRPGFIPVGQVPDVFGPVGEDAVGCGVGCFLVVANVREAAEQGVDLIRFA